MTVFIPTGIDHLDDLLSPDRDPNHSGGILVGEGDRWQEWETPIVLIEGTTGAGKTTLAFQIAHAAARCRDNYPPRWDVYFFSLEQSFASLARMAEGFGGFKSSQRRHGPVSPRGCLSMPSGRHHPPAAPSDVPHVTLRDEAALGTDTRGKTPWPCISVCHFSPRPISDDKPIDLFENRLRELQHVLDHATRQGRASLFIVDSFSAFCDTDLRRSDVHRLFGLFRRRHVPAIVTLETPSDPAPSCPDGDHSLESTSFLADLVISLSKKTRNGYLQMYLEIRKSRQCRQTIGEHLYRIRSTASDSGKRIEERTGIVVYPSIHYVLFRARRRLDRPPADDTMYQIDFPSSASGNGREPRTRALHEILNDHEVGPTSNFAIVGPNGTHKLALAMNLAMGVQTGRGTPKLMVLNFGGQGDVGFSGIAWTEFNEQWRDVQPIEGGAASAANKFWFTDYGLDPNQKEPVVRVVTFKIGQLAPEECLDILERMLEGADPPFTSVLLNNTAEIATGFPQLKAEPLFLPTLLDIFVEHDLVAVCIGIDDTGGETARLSNFTLLANADYRMRLSHYPTVEDLSGEIVRHARSKSDDKMAGDDTHDPLIEQLVSLVIDNVSGKHYAREPRWVSVKGDPKKILKCSPDPVLRKKSTASTP